MFAQERFQAISDLLSRQSRWTLSELQSELNVSPATLRRDVAQLESEGKLVRVRGAVVHPAFFRAEPTLAQKSRVGAKEKRAMAILAARLVPEGASVWIDAGTTCLAVGRLLMARRDVTILTHSLPVAALAYETDAAARVLCIGGEVRAVSGALVGALSLSWLENLRADWCFLGASGLAPEGVSTTELGEAALKTALLKRSSKRVLVCEARKWNESATVQFARWNEFDFWISDADAQTRKQVELLGPRVVSILDSVPEETEKA
jgi:DeoR/GlpR family transcriptional regulator of sugar metabolism